MEFVEKGKSRKGRAARRRLRLLHEMVELRLCVEWCVRMSALIEGDRDLYAKL